MKPDVYFIFLKNLCRFRSENPRLPTEVCMPFPNSQKEIKINCPFLITTDDM